MPLGNFFLASDRLDRQQELLDEQQQRVKQNQRAGQASSIGGSLLGLAATALAGPLGPLAMAAAGAGGNFLGGKAGAGLAGGYKGGGGIEADSGLLQGTAQRMKTDLRDLKQFQNQKDLVSAAKQGVLGYYMGGGSGDFAQELRKLRTRFNKGMSDVAIQEIASEGLNNPYADYNFAAPQFIQEDEPYYAK